VPGPTILFVHGHGGSGGAFLFLERELRRRGHERFAAWEYRSTGDAVRLAAALARFVDAELPGELHVIGHSLGGILSRLWLQEHGGRTRALSFTTLSTPHRGMAPVPGASLLPVVRDMAHRSALIARLERGAAALEGLPLLSVVSTRDHFVRPWDRAAFAHARVVPVHDAGHVGLLFSKEVARLVGEHLEGVR
jgi:triacylglycerol lipase